MNREELTERLQQLWIRASSSCGGATAETLAEIREIEKLLENDSSTEGKGP